MANADAPRPKRSRREGKCNSYLHFATVAANSAMGLRIGDDETYKFHPPIPAERKRRPFSRKKNHPANDEGRPTKSPASEIRGFMMHIRSAATSAHNTSYNSTECTPRASISSRPVSQVSFAPSLESRNEDDQLKKWWRGRSQKGRDGSNKRGRQTPGFSSQNNSTDLLSSQQDTRFYDRSDYSPIRARPATRGCNVRQRRPENEPQNISEPYNFQHHMHVQPQHFRRLADASQNDLVAEFSAIRAAQSARRHLDGIDAGCITSKSRYGGLTHSVPSSFQITTRSSMHVPEPYSPTTQSDQGIQYVAFKGSFSMPFRGGRSPQLQQQPSMESNQMMSISDDTVVGNAPIEDSKNATTGHRDPRAGALCSHCHSRVVDSDCPLELDAKTSRPQLAPTDDVFSTDTLNGLKTGFYSSPCDGDGDGDEFKALSPEPRARVPVQQTQSHTPLHMRITPLPSDNAQTPLKRSSVSGGLFSSWAAQSESSEDADTVVAEEQTSVQSPQKQIAARLMQRAARKAKPAVVYQAPTTPPPVSPLPRLPDTPCAGVTPTTASPTQIEPEQQPTQTAIPSISEILEEPAESQIRPDGAPQAVPTRRPSIKNVRFKTDDTLISNTGNAQQDNREQSHDRVQATLHDLQRNLSRLETDLSRKPSNSSRKSETRPKTSDGKLSHAGSARRHHRNDSGAEGRLQPTTRPARSKSTGHPRAPPTDLSKLHAPLPPLPPHARFTGKVSERYSRDGSITLPPATAISPTTTIAVQ